MEISKVLTQELTGHSKASESKLGFEQLNLTEPVRTPQGLVGFREVSPYGSSISWGKCLQRAPCISS